MRSEPYINVPRPILFAILGLFLGWVVASQWNPLPLGPRTYIVPLPYRLSKIPGGTSLRLAMVHDVLHERYLRHGTAWYAQRNAEARKIIAQESTTTGGAPALRYLDALDDLAVGLERTGDSAEALSVLRRKALLVAADIAPPAARPAFDPANLPDRSDIDRRDLMRISAAQTITPMQHHQYTTCANLGTVLILDALPQLLSGNSGPAIQSQIRQSQDYIERAIAINPGGHFGREVWQAILIEHLLAALDHPDLLTKYDMIGEPLVDQMGWSGLSSFMRVLYARHPPDFSDPEFPADRRLGIRMWINRVGIDPEWAAKVNPDYPVAMPFDEPTLAIVGMWTAGGGPNPHFALALGRIMENIGQNSIAWNAYERAIELQSGFWPDESIREKMVAACRAQQLGIANIEAPTDPSAWQATMRAQHVHELAWGLSYQKEYQDFEASRIAAGVALADPDFYTPFFQTHPPIASSPGLSDDAIVTRLQASSFSDFLPCLVLGLGAGLTYSAIFPKGWRK